MLINHPDNGNFECV